MHVIHSKGIKRFLAIREARFWHYRISYLESLRRVEKGLSKKVACKVHANRLAIDRCRESAYLEAMESSHMTLWNLEGWYRKHLAKKKHA